MQNRPGTLIKQGVRLVSIGLKGDVIPILKTAKLPNGY